MVIWRQNAWHRIRDTAGLSPAAIDVTQAWDEQMVGCQSSCVKGSMGRGGGYLDRWEAPRGDAGTVPSEGSVSRWLITARGPSSAPGEGQETKHERQASGGRHTV